MTALFGLSKARCCCVNGKVDANPVADLPYGAPVSMSLDPQVPLPAMNQGQAEDSQLSFKAYSADQLPRRPTLKAILRKPGEQAEVTLQSVKDNASLPHPGPNILRVVWDAENVPIGREATRGSLSGSNLVDALIVKAGALLPEGTGWSSAADFRARCGEAQVHLVLHQNTSNPWHFGHKEREVLIDAGVTLIDPGKKTGAVDTKVKDLLRNIADREDPDRTAVLLLGGDRDYAPEVRNLRERCFRFVALLHNGDARASMAELFAGSSGDWDKIRVQAGLGPLPSQGATPVLAPASASAAPGEAAGAMVAGGACDPADPVCWHYKQGRCKFGSRCRWVHPPQEFCTAQARAAPPDGKVADAAPSTKEVASDSTGQLLGSAKGKGYGSKSAPKTKSAFTSNSTTKSRGKGWSDMGQEDLPLATNIRCRCCRSCCRTFCGCISRPLLWVMCCSAGIGAVWLLLVHDEAKLVYSDLKDHMCRVSISSLHQVMDIRSGLPSVNMSMHLPAVQGFPSSMLTSSTLALLRLFPVKTCQADVLVWRPESGECSALPDSQKSVCWHPLPKSFTEGDRSSPGLPQPLSTQMIVWPRVWRSSAVWISKSCSAALQPVEVDQSGDDATIPCVFAHGNPYGWSLLASSKQEVSGPWKLTLLRLCAQEPFFGFLWALDIFLLMAIVVARLLIMLSRWSLAACCWLCGRLWRGSSSSQQKQSQGSRQQHLRTPLLLADKV
mmetsp:Transcript_57629/g.137029  ORF Transcript_57629/g.137029 Transcript_57629/m.137029 type:complete len:726 (-) Transcript_57629:47-2224(-)